MALYRFTSYCRCADKLYMYTLFYKPDGPYLHSINLSFKIIFFGFLFYNCMRHVIQLSITLFISVVCITKIASEISRHVTDRANGVKRLKDAIIQSFTASKSTVMPKCCPSDSLGLQQDPRFPVNVSMRLCLSFQLDLIIGISISVLAKRFCLWSHCHFVAHFS